jgi:hypothetical protein
MQSMYLGVDIKYSKIIESSRLGGFLKTYVAEEITSEAEGILVSRCCGLSYDILTGVVVWLSSMLMNMLYSTSLLGENSWFHKILIVFSETYNILRCLVICA